MTMVFDSHGVAIVVSRQQTRFQQQEIINPTEVDISGLNISIEPKVLPPSDQKQKKKAKPGAKDKDILNSAHLRLKQGIQYGLVGQNGSGKSTLLAAISRGLIPGFPRDMTISSLEQIVDEEREDPITTFPVSTTENENPTRLKKIPKTALEYVMEQDTKRREALQEVAMLSKAMEEDAAAQARAYRCIVYGRKRKHLEAIRRDASLRSGARGFKVRQDLVELERDVQEAKVRRAMNDVDDTNPGALAEILQASATMLADLQAQVDLLAVEDSQVDAVDVLKGLGFSDSRMSQLYSTLSGGWRMRCQLAATLMRPANLLLLDEPTNYLDLGGIIWLESYLSRTRATGKSTAIVVSHDRAFLDNICDELIILRNQQLSYFKGNLSVYEDNRAERKLYLTRMKEAIERQKSHMQKTIAENIKQGKKSGDQNKLRQAKSRQKKVEQRTGIQVNEKGFRFRFSKDQGSINSGSTAASSLQSRRGQPVIPVDERSPTFSIPQAADLRFPGRLISLEKASFSYNRAGPQVLHEIDISVHIGDRIGILGLNGAGKSTLIKLLTGTLQPSSGNVTHHPRLKMAYYSQHAVEELRADGVADPELTALRLLAREIRGGMSEGDMRGLLGSFGLSGRTASDVPIAKLSGGQLVRLALARIVWEHPQVLILDEISTHLDFGTVNALKEALVEYDGAVVLISHDRYLVKWVVEGGDADEMDGEDKELERGSVFLMRRCKLEKLESVTEFEGRLRSTTKT